MAAALQRALALRRTGNARAALVEHSAPEIANSRVQLDSSALALAWLLQLNAQVLPQRVCCYNVRALPRSW